MKMRMTRNEATSGLAEIRKTIKTDGAWIGIKTCTTKAFRDRAQQMLTEAGYIEGDYLYMENHIDPNMAHYRFYHPRLLHADSQDAE